MTGPSPLKFALLGLAGASIEWYDFLLYATAAALVFPSLFFPPDMPVPVALIASFGTFTVGFVARPAGALLFGHMGDRIGRKSAFALALAMMGVATTLIGLVPPYRSVGVVAPLSLVLLRVLQGLALGGQWGGATLLATENAPPARRGLYGGISQAGVPVGVVLANLSLLLAGGAMSPRAFLDYGWRIPFLLSSVLVIFGVFIHRYLEDTLEFRGRRTSRAGTRTDTTGVPPVIAALRRYPRQILLAAGAYLSSTLSFYILVAYVVSYGTSRDGLGLPRGEMLGAVLIASVVRVPCDILSGLCSDRFGRRRVFMAGLALMMFWAFALFPMLDTRSWPWILVATCVGAWSVSIPYGPMAALYSELFDTSVRYSAISVAYQLGAIFGGGFAPMIATALHAHSRNNLWISIYIATGCAVSMLCLSRLRIPEGASTAAPAAIQG